MNGQMYLRRTMLCMCWFFFYFTQWQQSKSTYLGLDFNDMKKWHLNNFDVFFPLPLPRLLTDLLYIWVTRQVSHKKQELLTLREHLTPPTFFFVGFMLLIVWIFYVIVLCVFTFRVLCCDVRYDFALLKYANASC